MALSPPRSKLFEAHANSAAVWQADLKKLFHHAKERYADVMWEVSDGDDAPIEEVYGHKAIVYARAPMKFQASYFSFRPRPPATPDPYDDGYGPDQSTFSLQIEPSSPLDSVMQDFDRIRGGSPSQNEDGILRLNTSLNPALFSNQLEYLYTAQGMGQAFEWLFEPETHDLEESEEERLDKLRKDLCYMWRSRLFADVRIALVGDFRKSDVPQDEDTAVVFFSHRFILVSRSPYFHKALQGSFQAPSLPLDGTLLTLQLPSTAFTPASLHWALGFMYAGTLNFSHRTFDLDTAFAIYRSAQYLIMATMRVEIEAYIIEEMLHGLFHAYLTLAEYEKITAGKWGVGGCRCRQCQRRVPRVLEFAQSPDIGNKTLDRGAMRGLVGMFGEGWCISEFAALSTKTRALVLNGLKKRTTPQNIFPLLFASEAALAKLDVINDSWRDSVLDLVTRAQKNIDEVLCDFSEKCFEQQEWLEIMDSDGTQFQDMDKVDWIMRSVGRGLKDTNAPTVYQTLVSSILLRPHPTNTSATLLPNNSPVRLRVEETRMEVIRWLKKHWINVRMVGGFDHLQTWSLTEIGHELEISIPDLRSVGSSSKGAVTRTGLHVTVPREKPDPDLEGNGVTATSMRANVLNRNAARISPSIARDPKKDVVHSVTITRSSNVSRPRESAVESNADEDTRSRAISTSSFASSRTGPPPEVASTSDSTPSTPRLPEVSFSRSNTLHSVTSTNDTHQTTNSLPSEPPARSVTGRRTVMSNTTSAADSPASSRPKSLAASVKSTTSTIRREKTSPTSPTSANGSNAANNTIKAKAEPRRSTVSSSTTPAITKPTPRSSVASNLSRPSSRVSDASGVSGSFKSAKSELEVPPVPRARTTSLVSTTSTVSTRTDSGGSKTAGKTRGTLTVSTPKVLRARKTSDASVVSSASVSNQKGTATPRRPSSQASVRSTVSSKTTPVKRTTPPKVPDVPSEAPKRTPRVSTTQAPAVRTIKKSLTTPSTPAVPTTPTKPKAAEPLVPTTPPVVVHIAEPDEPSTPPPLPAKEPKRDTIESIGGLAPTSQKDKRPSNTSTISTNSGSTIKVTRKRSNDTITELSEKDVSTLRAKALARLVGNSPSPSRPTAAEAVSPITSPREPASPTPSHSTATYSLVASPPSYVTPVTNTAQPAPEPYYYPPDTTPPGITLKVGIPCIIVSRRARFRAFARYLGEVLGERGPWIGVEVPLGEFSGTDKLEGRDWHDGSWNGVRYFEIQNAGWDDDEKAKRRRMGGPYGYGRKRDGESTLSVDQRSARMRSASPAVSDVSTYESRGLFVRPQQVLYVLDARADY